MKLFQKEITVLAKDLDENLHVNNVQYLYWVQEIARDHYTSVATAQQLEDYVWVAMDHYIEYKAPAFINEVLQLTTYVESFGAASSKRIVEIHNANTKKLICKTTTNWCLLNAKTQKPLRIPKEMTALFM